MVKKSFKNIHRLIQVATNSVPPEQCFLNDLTNCIEKQKAENEYIPSKSYKPSSMKCIRNMYFQMIGEKPDKERIQYTMVGICESGTDRHIHIQQDISKMKSLNMECEYIEITDFIKKRKLNYLKINGKQGMETKLSYPKLNLSFLCDGIIKYKSQYYILEIKTETFYKFMKRKSVAEEHIYQGIAYSICFGINQIMFLYECRDSCDKKCFILNISEEMKANLIGKIEQCDECVKRIIPPPKPRGIDRKICNYCRYKTACRKAGK